MLSVAHVDVVPLAALEEALKSDGVRLASVTGEPELIAGLPYGHADIVAKAVEWLRAAYAEAPDPGELLDEPFTLRDLRELHEAVAGATLMRDTFRRFMEPKLAGDGADVRRDAGEAVAVVGAGLGVAAPATEFLAGSAIAEGRLGPVVQPRPKGPGKCLP